MKTCDDKAEKKATEMADYQLALYTYASHIVFGGGCPFRLVCEPDEGNDETEVESVSIEDPDEEEPEEKEKPKKEA
jgi:hypothetical protein